MMNNRNYKMITIFTKLPILLKKRILLFITLVLTLVLIFQYFLNTEYIFLTVFFVTVTILCVGFVFYRYKVSLNYKIRKFIIHNNLYNDDISAEIGYLVTDEQILIRFKKC